MIKKIEMTHSQKMSDLSFNPIEFHKKTKNQNKIILVIDLVFVVYFFMKIVFFPKLFPKRPCYRTPRPNGRAIPGGHTCRRDICLWLDLQFFLILAFLSETTSTSTLEKVPCVKLLELFRNLCRLSN